MGKEIIVRRKKSNLKTVDNHSNDNVEAWVGYWRANIHRFINDYLGLKFRADFQPALLYFMDNRPQFILACSRGLGKSTLILLYCIARCILYPNTKIVVVAPFKKQTSEFIEKIYDFVRDSPNLFNELEDGLNSIKTGANEAGIKFANGSVIVGATYAESARCKRSNILIVDEFAMLKDKTIITTVFVPMLTSPRNTPYYDLTNEERAELVETNRQLYLSSIRNESEWSWAYFMSYMKFMVGGSKIHGALALSYHVGLKAGYLLRQTIEQNFLENPDLYELLRAEYLAIPIREDRGAFWKYNDFSKNRTILDTFIPMTHEEAMSFKNNKEKYKYYKEKFPNEIRIMSIDVALIAGYNNDNTSIHIFSLFPNGNKYKKVLRYGESIHGLHSKEQAIRVKQLYYEMEVDFVICDLAGNSIALGEQLVDYTTDPCRNITYKPWAIVNIDEVNTNKISYINKSEAEMVLYGIKADATINHFIYSTAKRMLEDSEIELPVGETEAIEYLDNMYHYFKTEDIDLRRRLLNTFTQTTILVNETVKLENKGTNLLKFEPKSGMRKDRFTSFVYGLYLIRRFEDDLIQASQKNEHNILDWVIST